METIKLKNGTEAPLSIPLSVLETMIISLISFPYPQICKHLVACDLLSIIEEHGGDVPYELAQAIAQANDERALELLINKTKLE
jgi:hypothetical protein